MTIEALAGDVVALLDHLGIAEADLFGFSLGGLVAYAVALGAPARVGKLIVASADAHRPPGRESAPLGEDRLPTRGRLPGEARRLRGGRSRPRALRRVRGQELGDGARVPGVDRRAAITAGADPADLRRPRLLAVASTWWRCSSSCRTRNSQCSPGPRTSA